MNIEKRLSYVTGLVEGYNGVNPNTGVHAFVLVHDDGSETAITTALDIVIRNGNKISAIYLENSDGETMWLAAIYFHDRNNYVLSSAALDDQKLEPGMGSLVGFFICLLIWASQWNFDGMFYALIAYFVIRVIRTAMFRNKIENAIVKFINELP